MPREVKEKLIDALKTISSDPDFLLSVINHVRRDEDRVAFIEYVHADPTPTYEDVLLAALTIYEQQNEKPSAMQ